MPELPRVVMTTDGAARGNPGPGGWAVLLQYGDRERLLEGEEPTTTTNNLMEVRAVLNGFAALKKPCRVLLRTDSSYVLHVMRRLLRDGSLPEAHPEIWQRVRDLLPGHQVELEWVEAHAGDLANERVDQASAAAAARAAAQVQRHPAPYQPGEWVLLLCSPSGERPVQWLLIAGDERRQGAVTVQTTPPTALYEALVAGLEAAATLLDQARPPLRVITNYDLLIKQHNGTWKIKKPEHQQLVVQAQRLYRSFESVIFEFGQTAELLEQMQPVIEV